jgi:hypothetical protein
MKPKYKVEFPDYDDTLPELEGFSDSSWRNDACPSISREIDPDTAANPKVLTIFVSYKDPSLRENGEQGYRYAVVIFSPYAGDKTMETLFATNDWSEVVKQTEEAK